MKRLKYILFLLLWLAAGSAMAQQPFSPGNLVVYRVGDGAAPLSGAAARVFLDEYTTSGTLVQSVPMPAFTAGLNSLLTVNGTDATVGHLNLSANGRFLVVPGMNIPVGSTSSATATVLGLVDFNGQVNTGTAVTDMTENGRKPYTAISDDGSRLWFGGNRVLRVTNVGSSTSTLLAVTRNVSDLDISGNQLFASYTNSSLAPKVGSVGTGLPVSTGQVVTDLPGLPLNISDAGQFAFADLNPAVPGVDVLYVTDGSFVAAPNKGIRKFSLVGGVWTDNGSVGSNATNAYYRGLVIKIIGQSVSLFATKSDATGVTGQQLVTLTDNSGYNGTLSGVPTILITAAPNTAMRGIAFTPQPAPFTAGNLVVYRVGEGSAALTNAAAKVFLDEYTPAGALVQSIMLPSATTGTNSLLTAGGSDVGTGYLNLSQDGKYLVLPGSNVPVGSTATQTATVLGLVDFAGVVNTSTVVTDMTENGRKAAGAISDNGTRIWFGGNRVIRVANTGASTSTLLAVPRNVIDFEISNNQLYASYTNSSLAPKLGTVGTGLPAATGQVVTDLPGLPQNISDAGQFAFADLNPAVPGADVVYVCDGSFSAGPDKGIRKFSLVGGSWTDNGAVGGNVANAYYRGLTLRVAGNTVTIFATRSSSTGLHGQELVRLEDNAGYNAVITAIPLVIASANGTKAFRGVARVPQGCPAVTELTAPDVASAQANVRWTASTAGNYEYAFTTSSTPPVSGTATTNTSVSLTGLTNSTTYYVHVRSVCSSVSASEWSTITFTTGCKSPAPIGISLALTDTTLDVKWNKIFGAVDYEYFISTSQTPPSSGTVSVDTSLRLTGLVSVTQYFFHLRSRCAGGAYSAWSTKAFETYCFKPRIVTVGLQAQQADLKWNNVANAQRYEFAVVYNAAQPLSGMYTTDTAFTVQKQQQSSAYFFNVRSQCKNGTLSDWTTVPIVMQGLQAYPSPVKATLTIRLTNVNAGSGEILIADATGKIVHRISKPASVTTVDTRGWAAGIYLVRYADAGAQYTINVLKL